MLNLLKYRDQKLITYSFIFMLVFSCFSLVQPNSANAEWARVSGNGANTVFVRDVQVNYNISVYYSEQYNKIGSSTLEINRKESSVSIGSNGFLRYGDISPYISGQFYTSGSGQVFSYYLNRDIPETIGDANKLNYDKYNNETVYINGDYSAKHQIDLVWSGDITSHTLRWSYD